MSEITTIARPYAKAIFESALEKNTLKEWSVALKNLAMIANNPDMLPLLNNPLLAREQLSSVFIDIAGKSLNDDAKRLVELLASRKRLDLLPAISKLYEIALAEREKTIEVKVVSAYQIDQARLQRLQHALQSRLNRQVSIQFAIDSALIGGAVIYAGDQVIDGSLRSKLKRLSESLCS